MNDFIKSNRSILLFIHIINGYSYFGLTLISFFGNILLILFLIPILLLLLLFIGFNLQV